jgi:hypothetical protein
MQTYKLPIKAASLISPLPPSLNGRHSISIRRRLVLVNSALIAGNNSIKLLRVRHVPLDEECWEVHRQGNRRKHRQRKDLSLNARPGV